MTRKNNAHTQKYTFSSKGKISRKKLHNFKLNYKGGKLLGGGLSEEEVTSLVQERVQQLQGKNISYGYKTVWLKNETEPGENNKYSRYPNIQDQIKLPNGIWGLSINLRNENIPNNQSLVLFPANQKRDILNSGIGSDLREMIRERNLTIEKFLENSYYREKFENCLQKYFNIKSEILNKDLSSYLEKSLSKLFEKAAFDSVDNEIVKKRLKRFQYFAKFEENYNLSSLIIENNLITRAPSREQQHIISPSEIEKLTNKSFELRKIELGESFFLKNVWLCKNETEPTKSLSKEFLEESEIMLDNLEIQTSFNDSSGNLSLIPNIGFNMLSKGFSKIQGSFNLGNIIGGYNQTQSSEGYSIIPEQALKILLLKHFHEFSSKFDIQLLDDIKKYLSTPNDSKENNQKLNKLLMKHVGEDLTFKDLTFKRIIKVTLKSLGKEKNNIYIKAKVSIEEEPGSTFLTNVFTYYDQYNNQLDFKRSSYPTVTCFPEREVELLKGEHDSTEKESLKEEFVRCSRIKYQKKSTYRVPGMSSYHREKKIRFKVRCQNKYKFSIQKPELAYPTEFEIPKSYILDPNIDFLLSKFNDNLEDFKNVFDIVYKKDKDIVGSFDIVLFNKYLAEYEKYLKDIVDFIFNIKFISVEKTSREDNTLCLVDNRHLLYQVNLLSYFRANYPKKTEEGQVVLEKDLELEKRILLESIKRWLPLEIDENNELYQKIQEYINGPNSYVPSSILNSINQIPVPGDNLLRLECLFENTDIPPYDVVYRAILTGKEFTDEMNLQEKSCMTKMNINELSSPSSSGFLYCLYLNIEEEEKGSFPKPFELLPNSRFVFQYSSEINDYQSTRLSVPLDKSLKRGVPVQLNVGLLPVEITLDNNTYKITSKKENYLIVTNIERIPVGTAIYPTLSRLRYQKEIWLHKSDPTQLLFNKDKGTPIFSSEDPQVEKCSKCTIMNTPGQGFELSYPLTYTQITNDEVQDFIKKNTENLRNEDLSNAYRQSFESIENETSSQLYENYFDNQEKKKQIAQNQREDCYQSDEYKAMKIVSLALGLINNRQENYDESLNYYYISSTLEDPNTSIEEGIGKQKILESQVSSGSFSIKDSSAKIEIYYKLLISNQTEENLSPFDLPVLKNKEDSILLKRESHTVITGGACRRSQKKKKYRNNKISKKRRRLKSK